MTVQHLSLTNEHYTPPAICDRARLVLGGIDLDPCSNDRANTLVQADRYFSADQDGFNQDWRARTLWMNPPGGRQFQSNRCVSTQSLWVDKLLKHYLGGDVGAALFLSFNLEILRHCQWMLTVPIAVFNERPRYWSWDDELQELRQGQWSQRHGRRVWIDNPGHPGLIACLSDDTQILDRFRQHFGDGQISRCGLVHPVDREVQP